MSFKRFVADITDAILELILSLVSCWLKVAGIVCFSIL